MIQFADFFFSKYDIQMKRNATTRSAAILNSVFLFWKCSLPIVSQVPTKVSGLCHFGLVYSWILWQSPDTPFLSCFWVSSCLCALFHVGAWCSDSGILVMFQAQFWFRVGGSYTHAPGLVSLWERGVSSSLGPYAPLSVCIRCLRFAFFCFVLLCVARSLCFSLAACFHVCHVLCEHAAYESPC